MYDELVKRLRKSKNEQCYIGCFGNCGYCEIDAELEQAADAIEERCQQVDKFAEEAARLYAKQPRWIPVTERLPEEWWPVLGLIMFHGKDEPPAQQVLWYLGNGHWREVWRGDMIENDVTHWMPLPEPPKEET